MHENLLTGGFHTTIPPPLTQIKVSCHDSTIILHAVAKTKSSWRFGGRGWLWYHTHLFCIFLPFAFCLFPGVGFSWEVLIDAFLALKQTMLVREWSNRQPVKAWDRATDTAGWERRWIPRRSAGAVSWSYVSKARVKPLGSVTSNSKRSDSSRLNSYHVFLCVVVNLTWFLKLADAELQSRDTSDPAWDMHERYFLCFSCWFAYSCKQCRKSNVQVIHSHTTSYYFYHIDIVMILCIYLFSYFMCTRLDFAAFAASESLNFMQVCHDFLPGLFQTLGAAYVYPCWDNRCWTWIAYSSNPELQRPHTPTWHAEKRPTLLRRICSFWLMTGRLGQRKQWVRSTNPHGGRAKNTASSDTINKKVMAFAERVAQKWFLLPVLRAEPFGCPLFCACHRHRMSSYYSNWLLTFFVTCLPGRCLVILRQGFDLKCFRFSFLYCFTFWTPTASAAPLRSWYDQNWFMKSKGRSGWGCATPTDKDLTSSKFFARYRQGVEC